MPGDADGVVDLADGLSPFCMAERCCHHRLEHRQVVLDFMVGPPEVIRWCMGCERARARHAFVEAGA